MRPQGFPRLVTAFVLCLLSMHPLSAVFFQWDPAGGVGRLDMLDIGTNDSTTTNYTSGEYYSNDGFLGRFSYQGEANNTITVTNGGPTATGGGASTSSFYYTNVSSTNRWRRVFLVATVKAYKHVGGEFGRIIANNILLNGPGASLTIPAGAGTEQVNPTSPDYSGGYNANGQWGSGATYIYKYPYRYIWIDLTVIRTTNTNSLNNAAYECVLLLSGQGISMALNLSGYRGSTSYGEDTYSFSVERTCPDTIPFSELMFMDSSSNSLPVALVKYNSTEVRARVYFASNAAGTATDFRFTNGSRFFYYTVMFQPITPTGTAQAISSTSIRFPTTASTVTFTSPTHGETISQYILTGQLRIFISPTLKNSIPPAALYTSTIYCFITSY